MESIADQKNELRRIYQQKRSQKGLLEWSKIEEQIALSTIQLLGKFSFDSVSLYLTSSRQREVDTRIILEYLTSLEKQMMVPRVTSIEGIMEMVPVEGDPLMYPLNRWGIPEPPDYHTGSVSGADITLIPMLAGDVNGYRLGYGKGYYDRYLRTVDTVKVGLCPADSILEQLPHDKNDIKMDYIITESEILRINA